MTTLTAWAFPAADDAEEAIQRLDDLQSQGHITIDDAAVVRWEPGKKKPKTRQLHDTSRQGALGGRLLGHVPRLALPGAIPRRGDRGGNGRTEHFDDRHGISDQFIDDVKKKVTPGTSALFLLMSDDSHVDRVKSALENLKPELVASNLSAEQEAKLREVFAED